MWTYSPSDVEVSVLGIKLEGFGSDALVKFERELPVTKFQKSMDGYNTLIVQETSSYLVTITLHQSSPSNSFLSVLNSIFTKYGNIIPMPVLLRDNSGSTTLFATDCWFEKEPAGEFTGALTNREWQIRCQDANVVIGGNGTSSISGIAETIQAALSLAGRFGIDIGSLTEGLKSIQELSDGSFDSLIGLL